MSPRELALITLIFWTLAPIFDKLSMRQPGTEALPILVIRFWMLALASTLMCVILGKWHTIFATPMRAVGWASLSCIFGGLLGLWAYYAALGKGDGDASIVVPIANAFPVFTSILAILVLGEPFKPVRVLGAVLVGAGVFFLK